MPAKSITEVANKKNILGIFVNKCLRLSLETKAYLRFQRFEKYIIGKKILDVGLGAGAMAKTFIEKGYDVSSIDIVNESLYPSIQPILYDGEHMPFKGNSFDMAILNCVLHHCSKPMKVLEETMRVSRRIVILEDTYRNRLEKLFISARDMVGNLEFYPHSYHTTHEWITIYKQYRWKTIHQEEKSSIEFYGMYGRQTLFVIEPERV